VKNLFKENLYIIKKRLQMRVMNSLKIVFSFTPQSSKRNNKKDFTLWHYTFLFLGIAFTFLLAFSFSKFSTEGNAEEIRKEVINYDWVVNTTTEKRNVELYLQANITVQNHTTLYFNNSVIKIQTDNWSKFRITIKDNSTLVLSNTTIEPYRSFTEEEASTLLLELTSSHLNLSNSILKSTTIIGFNTTAYITSSTIFHSGYSFSVWNNSILKIKKSEFISEEKNKNIIKIDNEIIYNLFSFEENGSKSSTSPNFFTFYLKNLTSFRSVSSSFPLCVGDQSISVYLYHEIEIKLYDGSEKETASEGEGYIEISVYGFPKINLSLKKEEGGRRAQIALFKYENATPTLADNFTFSSFLLENRKMVGRDEKKFSLKEIVNKTKVEFFFAPDLVLQEPQFFLKDKEVSTIRPGDVLTIKVSVKNVGNRMVRFNVYFYILFNIYDIFEVIEDVALGPYEKKTFIAQWDSSNYPKQKWNIKVTVDNLTPPEANPENSEVSKTIRVGEEESSGVSSDSSFMIFGLSFFVFLFSLYMLYVKRKEIFGDFVVEEVMLLDNKSGRLLAHFSHKESGLDHDVIGSMLHAIQEFINVSFQEKKTEYLKSLKHGEKMILIEYGKLATLAVVIKGTPSGELRREMQRLVHSFHELYRDILPHWDGDTSRFPDAFEMLKNLAHKRFGLKYELVTFVNLKKRLKR